MAILRCGEVEFTDIEAVLFDKDGTLANSEAFLRNLAQKRARLIDAQVPGVQEPLLLAFGVDGERLAPSGLMAVGSRHENEIAAAAYVAETGKAWLEALELVQSAFREASQHLQPKAPLTPPFPGTSDVLMALANCSTKIGLISADSPEGVQEFVQHHGLAEYVQAIQGTTTNGPFKPDPECVYQLCHKLGVAVAKTLVVGDALVDLKMAHQAGTAGFIGVSWGWSQAQTLPGADVMLSSWQELQVIP